jgi:hypothetical protein
LITFTLTAVGVLSILLILGCANVDLKDFIELQTRLRGLNNLYVRPDGKNENPGTKDQPKKDIRAAIDYMVANGLRGTVHVAEGFYPVDFVAGTHIVMADGVSLKGGYSSDFSIHNPSVFQSVIQDLSTNSTEYTRAVDGGTELTPDTSIEGFVVIGGQADESFAIYCKGSSPAIDGNVLTGGSNGQMDIAVACDSSAPHVVGNIINGGGGPGSFEAYGIVLINLSDGDPVPVIYGNTVNGGEAQVVAGIVLSDSSGDALVEANTIDAGLQTAAGYGVQVVNAKAQIRNNTISGGNTTNGQSFGIYTYFTANSVAIHNNTITGGMGGVSYSIFIGDNSSPYIDNNILLTTFGAARTHIHEDTVTSDPSSVRNNHFYDFSGPFAFYQDSDLGTQYIAAINDFNNTTQDPAKPSEGNVDGDPVFLDQDGPDTIIDTVFDNNWRLTGSSPVETRQGGLDGAAQSWGFNQDKVGNTRTNLIDGPDDGPTNTNAGGWSIGAYENDS